jgi:membrane-bound metal-dependent hydrolase YbcI (DUF457 family)
MDPVSHVVFGRMLASLDDRRRLGRGAVTAFVIGSLAPDVDGLLAPAGWDVYLLRHQGGTHSVVGALVCAALTAAAVRVAVRGSRYGLLLAAAAAGCLGHLLLDLSSGAVLLPLWPADGPRMAWPLFAMADPWLLGFFALSLLVIFLRGANRRRRTVVLFAILIGFAMLKSALYGRACSLEARASPPALVRRAEAVWGPFAEWSIYETRPDTVEARRVDAVSGRVDPMMQVPRRLEDAAVERSRAFQTVRNFLDAHDVTFAVVTRRPGAPEAVLWSDLRYCRPLTTMPASRWAPTSAGTSTVSCALWFGGEFDAAGHPAAALVYVGHLVQRRAISR